MSAIGKGRKIFVQWVVEEVAYRQTRGRYRLDLKVKQATKGIEATWWFGSCPISRYGSMEVRIKVRRCDAN
jgi:hypothetical protein